MIESSRRLKARKKKSKDEKEKVSNKKYPSTQSWLPFDEIVYGMVRLQDGRYIKILEIAPQNFKLKKEKYQNSIISTFAKWSKVSPLSFQIKVVTEKTDLSGLFEHLDDKTAREHDPIVLQAKLDYKKHVERLSQNESSTKRFYLIIQYEGNIYNNNKMSSNPMQIADDMNAAVRRIDDFFRAMGNPVIDHSSETEFLEEFLYRFICKGSSFQETLKSRKRRLQTDMRYVKLFNGLPDDGRVMAPQLKSVIAPRGLRFRPTYTIADGICYTHIFLQSGAYPERVWANWTACLEFGEGVDIDYFFVKQDREKLMREISNVIARGGASLKDAQEQDRDDIRDALSAAYYIRNALRQGEDFFYGVTMLTIWDYSYDRMRIKKGHVVSALRSDNIRTLPVLMDTEQAYRMYMPSLTIDMHLFNKFYRNFLSSSFSSMYPFDETRLYDEGGFVLGLAGNSLAVFNNFNTKRYNNANIGVFGPSGSGKTYLNLMLSRRFRLNDVGVLMILPLKGHEYKAGVEALNGKFLNLSPGSEVCLNIMAIHAEADIDAQVLADAEVTARSKLQQQITQVETFIQLLLLEEALKTPQLSLLESKLTELYKEYGITEDNKSLYDESGAIRPMPTIQELYDKILNVQGLEPVVSVLTPFIDGICKNMNGQTNVDLDNKVVAFDVSFVPERYLPAFMYTALVYSYDKIKENVYDLYALFLDEGWMFMKNQMAESYVNELIKIVRGYGGATIFSTQNLSDVLKGKYGESIIDNCSIKFLLKVGEKEEEYFKTLFRLSESEIKMIADQKKGRITMLSNGEKLPIETKASQAEHVLYTTDPNEKKRLRLLKN